MHFRFFFILYSQLSIKYFKLRILTVIEVFVYCGKLFIFFVNLLVLLITDHMTNAVVCVISYMLIEFRLIRQWT